MAKQEAETREKRKEKAAAEELKQARLSSHQNSSSY